MRWNTLYNKLSLTLLLLLLTLGVVWIYGLRHTGEMYQQEVAQQLNRSLAQNIVADEPLLQGGQFRQDALKKLFHMLMVINPSIELYLLDPDGRILSYHAPVGKVRMQRVDLAPVRHFLAQGENLKYPLMGDDPCNPGLQKVFSAARIPHEGDLEGYLYIILGGEQYASAMAMLQGSYIMRTSLWGVLVSLSIVLLFGFGIFAFLTRRLRFLGGLLSNYSTRTDRSAPLRYPVKQEQGGDEIDRLGQHFNRMAERLETQFEEILRNDHSRRELVANVSHDLRTPLANLQGYLETLLIKHDELSREAQYQYLQTALQHSQQLGRLVAELFELARLDSCETIVYAEAFSIAELIQDVIQKFALSAREKSVQLEMQCPPGNVMVHGDIGLIHRVLENLVENALRYTPAGGRIELGFAAQGQQAVVRVADTGQGIPQQELPHIFERFYQLEKSRTGNRGNAGLGLAIVKRILELHGSMIRVQSEEGHGTEFSFPMPISR